MLQELNMSDTRRSPFTEAALERILDSNLSAKYSLTGILKPDNSITNGFYDIGQVNAPFFYSSFQVFLSLRLQHKFYSIEHPYL